MSISFEQILFNPGSFTVETLACKEFQLVDGSGTAHATLNLSRDAQTEEVIDCCSYYGILGACDDKRAVSYAEALRLAEDLAANAGKALED